MNFREFNGDFNSLYISAMRPIFNRRGLFSDTTEEYVIPNEPSAYEEITIKFRTCANNVDKVFLADGDALIRKVSMNAFAVYTFLVGSVLLLNKYVFHWIELL